MQHLTSKKFSALYLKSAEQVKITKEDGTVIKAVLLINNAFKMEKFLIYNLDSKINNRIRKEYITIDEIQEIELIP